VQSVTRAPLLLLVIIILDLNFFKIILLGDIAALGLRGGGGRGTLLRCGFIALGWFTICSRIVAFGIILFFIIFENFFFLFVVLLLYFLVIGRSGLLLLCFGSCSSRLATKHEARLHSQPLQTWRCFLVFLVILLFKLFFVIFFFVPANYRSAVALQYSWLRCCLRLSENTTAVS